MIKYYICLCCSLFVLLSVPLISSAQDSTEDEQEITCTLTSIQGPVVSTSCKQFTMGEQVKITDITGRSIELSELPLPCSAEITHVCFSKQNCNIIKSILVLQTIREMPK